MDPYNMRAEELAVAECSRGVEVRRMWSEVEMVRSFGGHLIPGTPDGMFESWEGALTCVQVVRAPLLPDMNLDEMCRCLANTVLVKVIKSQQWLRASHIVPEDFIIFCWLPFDIPQAVCQQTHSLIARIRILDPRFSLRLSVPTEKGALFPVRFACCQSVRASNRTVSESDVSTFTGQEESDDEDDICEWDISQLAWEDDWSPALDSTLTGMNEDGSVFGFHEGLEMAATSYQGAKRDDGGGRVTPEYF